MTTVGITGHQNIPASALPFIRDGLRRTLRPVPSLVGVTSLAAGADQLFADTVLELHGELRVIVPCDAYESTFTEVDRRRYADLLATATSVVRLPHDQPSEDAFLDAGQRVADECELLIAIWDGEESRGVGGTADVVAYARERDRDVRVMWPEGVKRL